MWKQWIVKLGAAVAIALGAVLVAVSLAMLADGPDWGVLVPLLPGLLAAAFGVLVWNGSSAKDAPHVPTRGVAVPLVLLLLGVALVSLGCVEATGPYGGRIQKAGALWAAGLVLQALAVRAWRQFLAGVPRTSAAQGGHAPAVVPATSTARARTPRVARALGAAISLVGWGVGAEAVLDAAEGHEVEDQSYGALTADATKGAFYAEHVASHQEEYRNELERLTHAGSVTHLFITQLATEAAVLDVQMTRVAGGLGTWAIRGETPRAMQAALQMLVNRAPTAVVLGASWTAANWVLVVQPDAWAGATTEPLPEIPAPWPLLQTRAHQAAVAARERLQAVPQSIRELGAAHERVTDALRSKTLTTPATALAALVPLMGNAFLLRQARVVFLERQVAVHGVPGQGEAKEVHDHVARWAAVVAWETEGDSVRWVQGRPQTPAPLEGHARQLRAAQVELANGQMAQSGALARSAREGAVAAGDMLSELRASLVGVRATLAAGEVPDEDPEEALPMLKAILGPNATESLHAAVTAATLLLKYEEEEQALGVLNDTCPRLSSRQDHVDPLAQTCEILRATALLRLDRMADVTLALQNARAVAGPSPHPASLRSMALLEASVDLASGQPAQAIDRVQALLRGEPGSPPPGPERIRALLILGEAQQALHRNADAAKAFRGAAEEALAQQNDELRLQALHGLANALRGTRGKAELRGIQKEIRRLEGE